ncbi:DNA-binding helix-turn-helix protein [Peptoanaerobacter stomatis]|uniref:DNA-binding helix-turn-helix protein n=1 Tax=Peptoanaerobacter stomatis TaxID=796937 RepID=J5WEX2_9FIRM|nr:helix-turn-helix transcriptional regulator [Peptoanaerobacter stomatis]EJU21467.1 DNA-binding helix-turn-helix protein [Peptoanaerobacter stomatis]
MVLGLKSNINSYGLEVKQRLLEIGMTQKELSQKIGISEVNLSIILSGRRSGWKHRDKIKYLLDNTKSRRVI